MKEYSSFRDPSGYVFYQDGELYRQIRQCYQKQYDTLMESGLYQALISGGLLVEHQLAQVETGDPDAYLVIQPERIPFITYPYEWSFSQLKDAALTTLKIHRRALDFGMVLKDASAYNIQFHQGAAKLIDTLSFDFYSEGTAWVAYGQFCRHFFAPLFLMKYTDLRLQQLLRIYIDGIPLDLADRLLKGKGGFAAKQHIHWHAQSAAKHTQDGKASNRLKTVRISKFNHIALIDSLIRTIEQLKLENIQTEWMDYYQNTNYSEEARKSKEELFAALIQEKPFQTIWDLGANDGRFSRIALAHRVKLAVAFDNDPLAVDQNYRRIKETGENIIPLLLDLTNPSPGIGFANQERIPVNNRMKPDCIVALAVIHHLAISNNIPLRKIAEWLADMSDHLIIEFVPKEDSQVQILLATRDDIFTEYHQAGFEEAFGGCFSLIRKEPVRDSARIIYLFEKK